MTTELSSSIKLWVVLNKSTILTQLSRSILCFSAIPFYDILEGGIGMSWAKVLKDKFYEAIGWRDVTLSVIGNYPYKTIFKLRRGDWEIGFVQDGWPGEESNHYLGGRA